MKTYSIITVDDDTDDQFFLKKAIKQMDIACDISQAYNGQELMELLENSGNSLPDLIILDLNMPIMDGFEVLKKIRSLQSFKHIPVYILTTSEFEYDKIKAIAYGANRFYSKPAINLKLIEIMKEIFSDLPVTELTTVGQSSAQ